ncbi:hypothetical protein IA539_03710 [Gordonia sp. zg691]|uniref:DUF7064 domain-containing protein n=1 Tax=Gordonia jinghuaiqii TaxID=2758710 RepID=UPI0016627B52|nr:hypothetical protein [Gordonia jinghuaiqii]MBD0860315.1 hypothetical protein [Gordonia jinghuaiqii]
MNQLTKEAENFAAEHAYRHALRPDGRESLAHMLLLPEQGIAGFMYPTVRATGNGKGRAYLFGPSLPEPVTEEIEAPIPDGMDFSDWRVGPLQMAVREPHKTVDLKWKGDRIDIDGRYEALHPPYAFSMHPKGNPPYYGDDRTEQHGSFVADITVDGRSIHHAGFLIRDHSWGPRVWGLNQHHKWIHAVTPSCSVHLFQMQSFGRVHERGYVYRDGVLGHVASVEYDVRFDSSMMQEGIDAHVVDDEGRSVNISAGTFASIQLGEWDPNVYLNEAALEVTIDGEAGTGWAEFCWNKNYFEFASSHVTEYGNR